MFLVVEGVDGCGKSTQARLLSEWLEEQGVGVFLTAEPTSGRIGKFIREVLSGSENVDAKTLALLFTADRMEHISCEIEPALLAKKTVVCERYYHSTIAYQSSQGVDRSWLVELNRFAKKPDLTIFIDVDPSKAVSRTTTEEIFENKKFLESVRKNYLLFNDLTTVDGSGTLEEVFEEIKQVFSQKTNHL